MSLHDSTDEQLKTLRKAIVHRPPYCSGTAAVHEDELILYYGKTGDNTGRIDFSGVSNAALEHLSQVCDAATFGRNDQDVLDERYRKAGKLDRQAFSVNFDLETNGLMEIVRSQLVEGVDAQKLIHAELYKLNVYGEGSFFKPHKDTPRGETMFGSLVIIYPTVHEGGTLIFRDDENVWKFDSAQAAAIQKGPCVAYAAFFSDVDHEVTPVRSGYRITVTYNLYFVDSTLSPIVSSSNMLAFKSVFESLLADATFLPEGGILGFGLRREYPIMREPKAKSRLDSLKPCLKGSDANLLRACDALGLKANLWMVFQEDLTVAVSSVPDIEGIYLESDLTCYLVEEGIAKRINGVHIDTRHYVHNDGDGDDADSLPSPRREEEYEYPINFHVQWVTKPSSLNLFKCPLVAYGNEADLDYAYGHISLFVKVGKSGRRATAKD